MTEISQLPVEVIAHIMSYLSVSDRMSAGLVNRTWYEVSISSKFIEKQSIYLGPQHTDEVLKILSHSLRPFYHFIFEDVELKRTMPFWDLYGSIIKSLRLSCCNLSEKALVDILKCCNNLRILQISACRECLMSGRLLEDSNDIKELSEKFKLLHELSLTYNRYLSDALFNRLVSACPNLNSLSLLGCELSFHSGLYKKFYPDINTYRHHPSESVLTFLNVLSYIMPQAKKLKHLNFGHTLIDGAALAMLAKVENLKLETLLLQHCGQLTVDGIKVLSCHQTSLRVLDVSFCIRITDASLVVICQHLKLLEVLNIRRCRAVTDTGVQQIKSLKNLEDLNISECEELTSKCITDGLCSIQNEQKYECADVMNADFDAHHMHHNTNSTKNEKLVKFSVNSLYLDELSIKCIAQSFPNLRILDIGYCFTAVTDFTIQIIFKELLLLQVLKLRHCNKVSDVGLIGMGIVEYENMVIQEPTTVENPPNPVLRISLRSKAEEDIVRDADRKKQIMRLCENVSESSSASNHRFPLNRLKSLRELDLSSCNSITDISLKHTFVFKELKILDLSNCQEITHVGLEYLAKNNPAIEYLNLTHCYNVSDIGVSHLALNLCRLKRLLLQACPMLTNDTLHYVKNYCKALRYLDVRYCPRMTAGVIESLTYYLRVEYTKIKDTLLEAYVYPPTPPPMYKLSNISCIE